MLWLVPALLAYAILQPLVRYFQMQSLLLPMLITSCIVFCVHILLCWALVFKTKLKNVGGALSFSISVWLNVIILGLYMDTLQHVPKHALHSLWTYSKEFVSSFDLQSLLQ
ncbi:Protein DETOXIFICATION 11 [Stylosanthes scabra]|uniref:Protein DETOXIFICATION 11 n=1 Tax=Stylosanthes scabra TaxID=79078 RepID=A0ABU6SL21_9FABA|nr:Protein DETOXIFICATION 11 [Stylosanthes scabra]